MNIIVITIMIMVTLCDHDLTKAQGHLTLNCEVKERNKISVMMMVTTTTTMMMMMMMMMMIIIIIIIIIII